MAFFKYNREGQDKYNQGEFEPFLNVPKERRLAIDHTKDGNYRIRIMPPWSQEGAFAYSSVLHFSVGLKKKTVVCPNVLGGEECPFCRAHAMIKSEKIYEADSSVIRPSFRYFSNVVDMKLAPEKAQVSVWSYGPQLYFPIKKIQDSGEYGDITDPEEGRDLIIDRQVRGKVTDAVTPAGKPTMIQNPDWLDQLFDLDGLLPAPDMDLVQQLFTSHPWKVWEPSGRVSVSAATPHQEETPKEDVKEKLRAKMQQKSEPAKVEEKPAAPAQETAPAPAETQSQAMDVAARLRAKIAAKQQ